MSHFQIICAILPLIGVSACCLASSIVSTQIVSEVNKHLPNDKKFAEAFWYPGKASRVIFEHARFCPNSNLRTVRRVLMAIFAACVIMLALTFFYR